MPHRPQRLLVILLAFLALSACQRSAPPIDPDTGADAGDATASEVSPESAEDKGLAELERNARTVRLTGDLDAILKRGYLRVLVPHSKTFFFYEGARPRGLTYEFMEAFAKNLRKAHGGRLMVIYLPVPHNSLIPGIVEGFGDIAMAGLTATDERKSLVDFVTTSSRPVAEVIVTGPGAPPLTSLEELSGQSVFIRESSSYFESLQNLNADLRASGKPEVDIVLADEYLETEDILELVSQGVQQITVADDFLAQFWSDVMGDLEVHENLVLRDNGLLGPAVRKNSPQLMAALSAFEKTHGRGTLFGNVVFKRYFKDNPWVRNPNAGADQQRFENTLPLFQKYGDEYDFDTLLLVAQGYQESRLDQSTRNRSGAVGVMQIKPSTAASDKVNIADVRGKMDNNIHAGVKYLRHLADDYFGDPDITPLNQHLLAIAAYNTGPTRVQSLRRKAAAQGLDPNIWFNNVELVSAKEVGRQNVEYVRNILKYWVAFRLTADLEKPGT